MMLAQQCWIRLNRTWNCRMQPAHNLSGKMAYIHKVYNIHGLLSKYHKLILVLFDS
jgi:hypothetical protein